LVGGQSADAGRRAMAEAQGERGFTLYQDKRCGAESNRFLVV
jgi:hypothetical protein